MPDTPPTDPVAGPRRAAPRRRGRGWIVGGVAVLGLLWLAGAGIQLYRAQAAARQGLERMESVRAVATQDLTTFVGSIGSDTDDTPEERIVPDLTAASADFARARDAVDGPIVAPLKLVPVLGRQVRSVSAMADAAAVTTGSAAEAYTTLEQESTAPVTTPAERLSSVQRTAAALRRFEGEIEDLDLGPEVGLVGPLERARTRFRGEYDRILETLGSAARSADAVEAFLVGPNRYLVLASNNAEMRAGSGMFLQVGPMDVAAGNFTLGDLEPSGDLLLPAPGAGLDADVANLWGWALPGREWRNVNVTPRFDESARTAAEMWGLAGRGPVDGAVAVDVAGLELLLSVLGPVEVPGTDGGPPLVISAENVQGELLLEQYRGLDAADSEENTDRRELLGQVSTAVFTAFNTRQVSASRLLQAIEEAGRGRHLLLWSSDPVQQDGWEALGASGTMPEDSMLLSVLNRNGTKLDQFLDVRADLTARAEGDLLKVEVLVGIRNLAPPDLPSYVAGPFPDTDYRAGEYYGIVALSVPGTAGNFGAPGGELDVSGPDGDTGVLTSDVRLAPGERAELRFAFDLPLKESEVDVLPSARVPAVTWTVPGDSWPDDLPRPVDLAALG